MYVLTYFTANEDEAALMGVVQLAQLLPRSEGARFTLRHLANTALLVRLRNSALNASRKPLEQLSFSFVLASAIKSSLFPCNQDELRDAVRLSARAILLAEQDVAQRGGAARGVLWTEALRSIYAVVRSEQHMQLMGETAPWAQWASDRWSRMFPHALLPVGDGAAAGEAPRDK